MLGLGLQPFWTMPLLPVDGLYDACVRSSRFVAPLYFMRFIVFDHWAGAVHA
jgi:hypothetical protein